MTDPDHATNPPRRPGQPGADTEARPEPSPASSHPTGPHAPFEREGSKGKGPKDDARGQYAPSQASPNPEGLDSANPVVLSGDGDANGHGRDRDGRGPKAG